MKVRITFSNNETLDIYSDTTIFAWKSDDKSDNEDKIYYATMIFSGSNFDGSSIATSNPIVGLQGLFGNSDWFSTIDLSDKVFKTSSIVSLEVMD